MSRIRKDDKVYVIAGKDKGKTGKVLKVMPKDNQVLVQKINLMKKTVRKSEEFPQGGFVEIERPIHVSNVMLTDKKTNKPTRFRMEERKGKKVRISVKSGEVI